MKNKNMDEKPIQNLEITSEQELPKIDEKQVKKMHRKKILGNVFLFSSLTIAFASIITIPLVLNRKGSTSRDKFVSDKLEDTIYNEVELTKDKKYELQFTSKIDKSSNLASQIGIARKLETNKKFETYKPPLLKYRALFDFKGGDSNKFSNYNNKEDQYYEIKTTEFNFGKLDYLKLLTEHYQKHFKNIIDPTEKLNKINSELTLEKTIGTLDNISYSFTFIYENNGSYYYNELKNDLKGMLLHSFLEQIILKVRDFVKKYPNKKIKITLSKADFSLKGKADLVNMKISELYFDNDVIFDIEIE